MRARIVRSRTPRPVDRGSEAALPFKPLSAAVLIVVVAWLAGVARAERPSPPGQLTVAIAAADTDTFIDEWVSTPSSHAPVIHRVHEVGPDKTVYVAFIVSGHLYDSHGLSHVDVDWLVRRSDGRIDNGERAFAKLRGRYCGRGGFVMADPALTYAFDRTDPAGVWRFEATAHDLVNGTTATAVFPITLRK